jgi:hypothetical protein
MDLNLASEVFDGPGDPEFPRLSIDKGAKPDALDDAPDDDSAACTHRKISKNLWSYTTI